MKYLKKCDKIIALIVIFIAAASYAVISFTAFSDAAKSAEVYVGGELYGEYDLQEIKTERHVRIKTENGENLLELTNDGARMLDASCPDKKDVKSGKITKPGQVIICIPNKVLVKLVGDGKDKVDKVSY